MSETRTQVSRRQFCAGACTVASGATIATLLSACGGGSPTSPTSPGGSVSTLGTAQGRFANNVVQVTVAGSALNEIGGAVLVESIAGVFLLARTSAAAFTAVDAVCSHQSCTVTGTDGTTYVCPCHGSRYSRTGQVVGGPAMASLRQFAATFSNGVVSIAL